MLSIVIPTLNAAAGLPACLAALYPALGQLSLEVIVVDGGSTDDTVDIAEATGARVIGARAGRGSQLRAGAAAARGDWLLFLHADTVLSPEWVEAAASADPARAGYGRLRFDDDGIWASLVAAGANRRSRWLGLPYGDQALLIARPLYRAVGGYPDWPLMEDVGLAGRLGRRRLRPLGFTATTSADRYRRDGWLRRVLRNLACLTLFLAGMAPARIARLYAR